MKKIFTILLLLVPLLSIGQNHYRNWDVKYDTDKEKIALVIANNYYEYGGNLIEPIPTAFKLEKALKNRGVDVLIGHDLNRVQFLDILTDFSKKLESYQVGMIFYLGHGFQIDGENFLIPTDAKPKSKIEVKYHAIDVDDVLKMINYPNKPKLIVLDACRDNPFKVKWTSRERSSTRDGLGDVTAPRNAEIFFTTQKNSQVRDDNPYMNYFMDEINKGGCLDDIVRNVSKRINQYNSNQIPAKYGQLFDDVCFGRKASPSPNSNTDNLTAKELFNLGYMYDEQKNIPKAIEYYEKAALKNHDVAQYNLGIIYENGNGVSRDYTKAAYWYQKAVNNRYRDAYLQLGDLYLKGEGVKIDGYKALELYNKAKNMSHIETEDIEKRIGYTYLLGYGGVPKDERKAFEIFSSFDWLFLSPNMEIIVGIMYLEGKGTEQNYDKAIEIISRLAKEGHDHAQYCYGSMCLEGQGLRKNRSEGISWLEKSAKQGHEQAQNKLKEMGISW